MNKPKLLDLYCGAGGAAYTEHIGRLLINHLEGEAAA